MNLSELDILWKDAEVACREDHALEVLGLGHLYLDDVFDVCHELLDISILFGFDGYFGFVRSCSQRRKILC
jgi:hypothetical protein